AVPCLAIAPSPPAARPARPRLPGAGRAGARGARAAGKGARLREPGGARENRRRPRQGARGSRGAGRRHRSGARRHRVRQARRCRRGRRHAGARAGPRPRRAVGGVVPRGWPAGGGGLAFRGALRADGRGRHRRLRRHRRVAGQGRRLRHPGPRRGFRRTPVRQLLRRHGIAPVRDGAALAPLRRLRTVQGARVSEEILINVTPRETRVAVVENGMLQEVHIERASRRGYVGNIYKGRVLRVMPGMQAAFVEVGLDRAAFLHASDILRIPPVVPPEDAENGTPPATPTPLPPPPIADLVREGQEVVVQVVKDPIGSKGARLTTQLSIPSRYLVLLPYGKVLGVSARIED